MSKKKHEWTRKGVTASMAVVMAFGMVPATSVTALADNGGVVPAETIEDEAPSSQVVAKIGETAYSTLESAVSAADSDDEIVLQSDVELDQQLTIQKKITLDGNGKTIRVSDDATWSKVSGSKNLILISGDEAAGSVIKNVILDSGSKAHSLQVYDVSVDESFVKLVGLTVKNSAGSGLNINGSFVELSGLNVSDSQWGQSVDLSKGSSSSPSKVRLSGNISLADSVGIFEDVSSSSVESTAEVTNGETKWGAYLYKYPHSSGSVGYKRVFLSEAPISVTGIESEQSVGYANLLAAIEALEEGDTLTLQPGEYDVTSFGDMDGKWDSADGGKYGTGFIIDKNDVTIEAADPTNKPIIYGFSNEFNAGLNEYGKNGQDTIYVSGSDVTLENLKIMPLGGIGAGANDWQKAVEVVNTASEFEMKGCETSPNTKLLDGVQNSMSTSSGLIHISTDDAVLSNNVFGLGAKICAGWKTQEGSQVESYCKVTANDNQWLGQQSFEGIVVVDGDAYVTDEVSLRQGLSDSSLASKLILANDIELNAQLDIAGDNIEIDLNNKVIFAGDNFSYTMDNKNDAHLVNVLGDSVTIENGTLSAGKDNKHVLNAFGAENVTVKNVALDHSAAITGAPLMVNSSSVTLLGNNAFVMDSDSWYAVGVSPSPSDKELPGATLTIGENASVKFKGDPVYQHGINLGSSDARSAKLVFDGEAEIEYEGSIENFPIAFSPISDQVAVENATGILKETQIALDGINYSVWVLDENGEDSGNTGGTGGSSPAPTPTPDEEVTENPDGSTTTTVTEEDGSSTLTTVSEDGSVTTVVEKDADGNVAAVAAAVSQEAVDAAEGGAVRLPMAEPIVPALSEDAPEIAVAAPAGARVAVPVACAEGSGEPAPGAVLVLVAEDGERALPKTGSLEGALAAEVPEGCTLKVVDASADFPDVSEDDWFAGVADFASARNILSGVVLPDGTAEFQGDLGTTRAMFVTMLNRLEMEPEASEGAPSFSDVDYGEGGDWYAGTASWAAEEGLLSGYAQPDGTVLFGGEDPVTREQVAVFLMRYAEWLGLDTSARAESAAPDASEVSSWAAEAVSWATAEGYILGDEGTGAVRPADGASRAEAAAVVMRFVNSLY